MIEVLEVVVAVVVEVCVYSFCVTGMSVCEGFLIKKYYKMTLFTFLSPSYI